MGENSGQKQSIYTSVSQRAITGILLVIAISIALLSGPYGLLLLVLIINYQTTREYYQLIQRSGYTPQKTVGQAVGLLIILISWAVITKLNAPKILSLILPLLTSFLFFELFRKKSTSIQNAALTLLGIVWISMPLATFLYISFLPAETMEYNPLLNLGYFVILWFGDTGAYLVGMAMGKNSLFKRISPRKTIEGSVGGLVAALSAAVLNAAVFGRLEMGQWLLLAFIINLSGTFGDFAKSMLKRSVHVKDAGNLLPGHGGFLDRFDSLIGSAPFAFIYLFFYA